MADKMSVCAGILLACHLSLTLANELARGWGDQIQWMALDDGFALAESENKPLMLIIHKSWCGACKALKPKFAESTDIKELSNDFVMVNVQDDEEPSGDQYTPDGGYIPRILFFDSNGSLLKDMYNEGGNAQYKYFYFDAQSVHSTMTRVLDTVRNGAAPQPQDEL